ncbi:MAG TPA: Ig-like domain-containing protein, partial [Longimicrobium sp.]
MKLPTPLHRGLAMWALLVLAACSGGDGSPTATPVDPPAAEPTLVLSPTAYTLEALGDTVQLQALLRGGNGESSAAPQVTWTALDPDIAMVDEEGRVRSLSPGDARVLASSRGKTDTARIRVTQSVATLTVDPANPAVAVDASLQMRALAFDRKGAPVTGLQIEWTSSDAAVAPVTNDGSVSGKAAGTATVTAHVGGKTASTSVAVTAKVPVVASITLSPANPTVQVGATVLMQTVVQDAAGRPIGVDLAWSSSNPGVASVSPEGLVTGRAAGTATVTVTAGGKSLSTLVTVPAPPPVVASITLTPANPTVAIGATAQMQAVVRDAEGITMAGVPLSWGSSDEGVAVVSPAGVVTAKAAGTASI